MGKAAIVARRTIMPKVDVLSFVSLAAWDGPVLITQLSPGLYETVVFACCFSGRPSASCIAYLLTVIAFSIYDQSLSYCSTMSFVERSTDFGVPCL